MLANHIARDRHIPDIPNPANVGTAARLREQASIPVVASSATTTASSP